MELLYRNFSFAMKKNVIKHGSFFYIILFQYSHLQVSKRPYFLVRTMEENAV